MGMTTRLSPRAIADLDGIREYIVAHSPRGAENVRTAIAETIDLLGQFPGAGRTTTIPGVRVIPVVRYNYLIYDTLMSDDVVILHIRHAARREPERGEF
jgi:toxin ParE1/3/4